jgi:hypothetical protein
VSQDGHRLIVTEPLQGIYEVQPPVGSGRVQGGFDLWNGQATECRQPFGGGGNQRVVAPGQDVDLVLNVSVAALLAGNRNQGSQGNGES